MTDKKPLVNNIALFIAILFHVSGAIGILFSAHADWIISNTPLNLLLMAALLFITQKKLSVLFIIFFLIVFITGVLAELLGTNTALLFGNYSYGNTLGLKVFNTPLIIGINWFIVIYCTGVITNFYENRIMRKMEERGIQFNEKIKLVSFITDAALLTVLFDWLIEPVAVKLGFWQWNSGAVPFYNYICWFVISALLLVIFRKLNFDKQNIFAVHLFIIQALFFLVLRTFL